LADFLRTAGASQLGPQHSVSLYFLLIFLKVELFCQNSCLFTKFFYWLIQTSFIQAPSPLLLVTKILIFADCESLSASYWAQEYPISLDDQCKMELHNWLAASKIGWRLVKLAGVLLIYKSIPLFTFAIGMGFVPLNFLKILIKNIQKHF